MRAILWRHQPSSPATAALKAGLGGLIGIALIGGIGAYSGIPWLMAPLGATCVLLFSAPGVPYSQPANVVGGHLLSSAVGLLIAAIAPTEWWSLAAAVGLAIGLMHALRVTHPPAGADPIVVLLAHPGWDFLLFPVLAGSLALLLCAMVLRHLPPKTIYPLPLPEKRI